LITAPDNPTKEGYSFIGWDISIPSHMPSNNLTIKALWEMDTYQITYVLNGGINDSNNPSEFTIFTESFIYSDPTKEGHTFDGWYQNSDFSGTKTTFFLEGTSSDITLYAKWNINSYNINYYIQPDEYDPLKDILLTPGESIVQVELNNYNSAVLTFEGRLFTRGYNAFGQLGDGTITNRYTPTEITNQFSLSVEDKIISISLDYSHSAALTSSGRLFTWGYNSNGQLGDGTTTNMTAPTEITSQFILSTGDQIISVSLGYNFSAAITYSGRIFTWGYNAYGQLGDGTTTVRSTPTEIIQIHYGLINTSTHEYNQSITVYLPTRED